VRRFELEAGQRGTRGHERPPVDVEPRDVGRRVELGRHLRFSPSRHPEQLGGDASERCADAPAPALSGTALQHRGDRGGEKVPAL
jgi:hypothetical protein